MVTRYSIRKRNEEKFKKCIELRKQGLSYSEIQNILPVAKSTLQNWIVFAGLTHNARHLEIQLGKKIENHRAGTEAARLIREEKTKKKILRFVQQFEGQILDPFIIGGCFLYEAEGQKRGDCKFSNSDYRLINYFLNFIEKYFDRDRKNGVNFRLYIHKNREKDLEGLLNFWTSKLGIKSEQIAVSWKKNLARIRSNKDYVGQMMVYVKRGGIVNRQIRAFCDILLEYYAGSSNGRTIAFGAMNSRFES